MTVRRPFPEADRDTAFPGPPLGILTKKKGRGFRKEAGEGGSHRGSRRRIGAESLRYGSGVLHSSNRRCRTDLPCLRIKRRASIPIWICPSANSLMTIKSEASVFTPSGIMG